VGALSGLAGQHQTLFPTIASGSDQFDPGSSVFGLYVLGLQNRLSYTEDALNAGGPALHAVRVYPMKNRLGQPAENSYLICFEDASNGDYQDYVFVLSNVIPAGTRKNLALAPQNLYFNVPQGGSVPAKTVTLTASNGTPTGLTLTKSGNSNWLVLPGSPAVGSLSFAVNAAGLEPGVYTSTVTASATGFTAATVEVTLVVTGLSANAVRINFQPTTTVDAPAGYAEDNGGAYTDARGYGWINPSTKLAKDHSTFLRERTGTAELRLRTLILMQPTGQTPGAWEYRVPAPGLYNVTVSVGDQDFGDSRHQVNVEGIAAIRDFVPVLPGAGVPSTSVEVYRSATVTVEVLDGKLTIDAVGGTNTKLNYVIIDPASADGDLIPPVATISLQGHGRVGRSVPRPGAGHHHRYGCGWFGPEATQYSVNGAPYTDYAGPRAVQRGRYLRPAGPGRGRQQQRDRNRPGKLYGGGAPAEQRQAVRGKPRPVPGRRPAYLLADPRTVAPHRPRHYALQRRPRHGDGTPAQQRLRRPATDRLYVLAAQLVPDRATEHAHGGYAGSSRHAAAPAPHGRPGQVRRRDGAVCERPGPDGEPRAGSCTTS
jgi:hypothetical protein